MMIVMIVTAMMQMAARILAERRQREATAGRILAERNFLQFAKRVPIGGPFVAAPHHAIIAREVENLLRGDVLRLMLLTPPRHGKTRLISHLAPAYALGRNPREQIIACSYAASLAESNSRAVQRVIDSEQYQAIFPNTTLNPRAARTAAGQPLRNVNEWEPVDRNGQLHGGIYKCAGVGGGITGRGFSLGIIDDPIRDAKESDSAVIRDSHWEWYRQVFRTRALGPRSRILMVMTRWHGDDLGGRIIDTEGRIEDGGTWRIVTLPALMDMAPDDPARHPDDTREQGEPLWPGGPFFYDTTYLGDLRDTLGSRAWSALYQQRPSPADGSIWRAEWFRQYRIADDRVWLEADGERIELAALVRFATVDPAISTKANADWSVIVVWGRSPATGRNYVLDVRRGRWDAPTLIEQLKRTVEAHRLTAVGVETVAYQTAVLQFARRDNLDCRLIELKPDVDKVARSNAASVHAERNGLWMRDDAPWRVALERELLEFPLGAHDDQVDAVAYGLLLGASGRVAVTPTMAAPPRRSIFS